MTIAKVTPCKKSLKNDQSQKLYLMKDFKRPFAKVISWISVKVYS